MTAALSRLLSAARLVWRWKKKKKGSAEHCAVKLEALLKVLPLMELSGFTLALNGKGICSDDCVKKNNEKNIYIVTWEKEN